MTIVWRAADPGERGEQARVDAAGAQVGALAGREDDPRVGEQLADGRRVSAGELDAGPVAAPR